MATPAEVGKAIEDVARRVGPSVAGIGRGARPGSAVVVGDGRVLTAGGPRDRDDLELVFADGRREAARRIASDIDLGLSLLEAETGEAPAVAPGPDEDSLPGIGAPVFALADPSGRGLRVTLGFVSSTGRSFRGPRRRRVEGAIEHTAPLPRGSSGGPLVNAEGRLLGINLLRREGGLILAVPAGAHALDRLERIAAGESVSPPRLGVALAPPRVARRLRQAVGLSEREGLLVRGVEPETPAAEAGVTRGDLLVSAAGRDLSSVDALVAQLEQLAPGHPLELSIVRGEEDIDVVVRFDAGSDTPTGAPPQPAQGRHGRAES